MKSILAITLCLICAFAKAEAGFSNSGIIQNKSLNISVAGTFDNTGKLIGTDDAKIVCETFSGDGLIRAPNINIETEIFAYTGTIDCTEKCVIITSTPFNEKMFKHGGMGEFVIIVDKKANLEAVKPDYDYIITD